MSQNTPSKRPLSPHLQIYRLPLLALMSITHRITGVMLSMGSVFIILWLLALASGPETFAFAQGLAGSWLGKIVLFPLSFAFFYHFFNGLRHLMWDNLRWLAVIEAEASGKAVLALSVLATLVLWLLG